MTHWMTLTMLGVVGCPVHRVRDSTDKVVGNPYLLDVNDEPVLSNGQPALKPMPKPPDISSSL